MIRLIRAKSIRNNAHVMLLALLLGCMSVLAGAHVHELEQASTPTPFELAEDCVLCHASHGFAFESHVTASPVIRAHSQIEVQPAKSTRLGYSYSPEARAPPSIS